LRTNIFKELCNIKQLGVDHTNVQIEITARSDAEEAQLKEMEKVATPAEMNDIRTNFRGKPLDDASVGCKRTVHFPDGAVVSELVELTTPSVIRWRQLESKRGTNMIGKPGGPLPEVAISLDELPDQKGTSIRMTYDFYQIVKEDGTPLDGSMMSKLLSQATQGWSADMASRGYATIDGGAPMTYREGFLSDGPTSTVLRSARRMKEDLDEEKTMKEAMLAKAKAAAAK